MSEGAYVGVNGVARQVMKGYIGVDGVSRRITNAYIGIDNVGERVFSADRTISLASSYTAASCATITIQGKIYYGREGDVIVPLGTVIECYVRNSVEQESYPVVIKINDEVVASDSKELTYFYKVEKNITIQTYQWNASHGEIYIYEE